MPRFQRASLDLKKCTDIGISPLPPPSRNQWLFPIIPWGFIVFASLSRLSTLQTKVMAFPGLQHQQNWCLEQVAVVGLPVACSVLSDIHESLPRRCQELSPPTYDQQHLQADRMTLALTKLSLGPLSSHMRAVLVFWEGVVMATKCWPVILWS